MHVYLHQNFFATLTFLQTRFLSVLEFTANGLQVEKLCPIYYLALSISVNALLLFICHFVLIVRLKSKQ